MSRTRKLLEEYVAEAKVLQLATVDEAGTPSVCNLWFASTLSPDRLYFISRPARIHCAQLRDNEKVAGAILDTPLDFLGGIPPRGVTFKGNAKELATTGVDSEISVYTRRWPKASRAIDPGRLARGENHHRIYEIVVTEWILFDELNYDEQPKQPVDVH